MDKNLSASDINKDINTSHNINNNKCNDLCSCCIKLQKNSHNINNTILNKDIKEEKLDKVYQSKMCYKCNKKLKISAYNCQCGFYFCKKHLFYENHNCVFDYKQKNKDILKNKLKSCIKEKLNKI